MNNINILIKEVIRPATTLVFITFLGFITSALAQRPIFVSKANGGWNNSATWDCISGECPGSGVPKTDGWPYADVRISHSVTYFGNLSMGTAGADRQAIITINEGSKLRVTSKLTIGDGAPKPVMNVNGELEVDGDGTDGIFVGGTINSTGTITTSKFQIGAGGLSSIISGTVNTTNDFIYGGSSSTTIGANMNVGGNMIVTGSATLTMTGLIQVTGNLNTSGSTTLSINMPGYLQVASLINNIESATITGDGNISWGTFSCSGTGRLICNSTTFNPTSLPTCKPGGGSSFNLGTCGIPLPVDWYYFNVKRGNGANTLNWATLSEKNNDFFTIERSFDGIHFEAIAFVNGSGTSAEKNTYQYSDHTLYNGVVYYRIKQTDYDGSFDYSSVVLVNMTNNKTLEIYPNPCPKGELGIYALGYENIDIIISDLQGRIITDIQQLSILNGYQIIENEKLSLETGIYIIQLRTTSENVFQKIEFN